MADITGARDLGRVALAAAGLLILAGAAPALADKIPGDSSTKATLQVTNVVTEGVFETAADSDWYRVQLTKGQDYAVKYGLVADGSSLLTLRSASGKPFQTVWGRSDGDSGFEFRAPYTGIYFVDVKNESDIQNSYYVAVVHDCKDGLDTRCRLVHDKIYHVGSAWYSDHDVYAAALDRSKWYTFTAKPTGPAAYNCEAYMELLDITGKVIVPEAEDTHEFDSESIEVTHIKEYKPPTSSTYYLRARNYCDDYGSPYYLLMTVR